VRVQQDGRLNLSGVHVLVAERAALCFGSAQQSPLLVSEG
jgi:hypothetical protein